jgi:uncharacterized protein (TIGR04255 family)
MAQTESKMKISPLSNPFLLESIFEVRWELLEDSQSGRFCDPAYPMMYGRIYEHVKNDFPLIEDLPSVQAHPDTTPYMVRHRLRKESNSMPLIQIGPGILTVNDAKGYSWFEFKSLAIRLVELIDSLYPTGTMKLNFVKAELRYITGIPFTQEDPLSFLSEKLRIRVSVPQDLLLQPAMPNNVGLNLAYPLEQPVSNLLFSANLGHVDSKPAYILQSVIQSLGEVVPKNCEEFDRWLGQANISADQSIQSLSKGLFMHQLTGAL